MKFLISLRVGLYDGVLRSTLYLFKSKRTIEKYNPRERTLSVCKWKLSREEVYSHVLFLYKTIYKLFLYKIG